MRQGGHQVAQKFTSTTLPRSASNDHFPPCKSFSVNCGLEPAPVVGFQFRHGRAVPGIVERHLHVLVARQEGERTVHALTSRQAGYDIGDCLQRLVAGVALGGQAGEAADQAAFALARRQRLNLAGQPPHLKRPFVVRQGAQVTHAVGDRLLLAVENRLGLRGSRGHGGQDGARNRQVSAFHNLHDTAERLRTFPPCREGTFPLCFDKVQLRLERISRFWYPQ